MNAPALYPDQVEFVDGLRTAMRTNQAVLAHAATGFGKTVVAAHIAKTVSERGKRVIFAVHRRDLVRQTAKTFAEWGIGFGYIAAGHRPMPHYEVQIATIETLRRRLDKLSWGTDLLYIDECHLACSPTWSQVIAHFRAQGAHVIGNTATPIRLDGRGLDMHFDTIVSGPPMRELIDEGRLSDYRIYAPRGGTPDLSGVHMRGGDYVRSELEEIVDTQQVVGDAAEHYHRLMPGARALAFCVSIRHSKHVTEQLCAAGIPAAHIDGTMSDDARKAVITAFADGVVRVLCNVELLTTGFDLSSQVGREVPVQGGIMLRPTMSLSLWLQMLGRLLRRKDEPAIILDHVGGTMRHDLPDEEREWTLEGARGKKGPAEEEGPAIRLCKECYVMYRSTLPACPNCGVVPVQTEANLPDVTEGELEEIDAEVHRKMRRQEQGLAKGLEALVMLAKERGHKIAWAGIVHATRTKGDRTRCIRDAYKIDRELEKTQKEGVPAA